jgi:hypothetical protein
MEFTLAEPHISKALSPDARFSRSCPHTRNQLIHPFQLAATFEGSSSPHHVCFSPYRTAIRWMPQIKMRNYL